MRAWLECWIAEQLAPLGAEGISDLSAAAWLERHRNACGRHGPPVLANFGPDPSEAARALRRIAASFGRPGEAWAAGRLSELLLDWRLAPVPMAALAAASLVLGFGRGGMLVP